MKTVCVFTLTLLMLSSCTISKQDEQEETPVITETNELFNLTIATTTGKQVNLQELTGKNIIIVFDAFCDHCQDEASQISENLSAFSEYAMYWISVNTLEEQKNFAVQYGLDDARITFGLTDVGSILRTVGNVSTPSIYIYNDQRKLVKHFNGPTPVDEIIRFL